MTVSLNTTPNDDGVSLEFSATGDDAGHIKFVSLSSAWGEYKYQFHAPRDGAISPLRRTMKASEYDALAWAEDHA